MLIPKDLCRVNQNPCVDATNLFVANPGMPIRAERVKQRMTDLGKNCRVVGQATGVHYQTIQHIAAGRTKNPTFVAALAKALGTTPEWLYGEESPEPLPPDEIALLERYRAMTDDQKQGVLALLGVESPPERPKPQIVASR